MFLLIKTQLLLSSLPTDMSFVAMLKIYSPAELIFMIFEKLIFTLSNINSIVSAQVEFQDQSQLMLKPSEIHQLDQELPKRVRARLVSIFLKFSSLLCLTYNTIGPLVFVAQIDRMKVQ